MEEPSGKTASGTGRAALVERRLKRFASLRVDPAEVRASREFHLGHWLRLAEAAIRNDHRELFYQSLTLNLEAVVADYPDDDLPAELQQAVLKELAFMEGHLQALREILALIEKERKRVA